MLTKTLLIYQEYFDCNKARILFYKILKTKLFERKAIFEIFEVLAAFDGIELGTPHKNLDLSRGKGFREKSDNHHEHQ